MAYFCASPSIYLKNTLHMTDFVQTLHSLTIILTKDEIVHAPQAEHIEEIPWGWTDPKMGEEILSFLTKLKCDNDPKI